MPTTHAVKITSAERILTVIREHGTASTATLITETGLGKTTINDNIRKLAASDDVRRVDAPGSTWELTDTRKRADAKAAAKAAKAAAPKSFAKRLGTVERGLAEAGLVPAAPKPAKKVNPRAGKVVVHNSAANDRPDVQRNVVETPAVVARRTKKAIDGEIIAYMSANTDPIGSYKLAQGIGSRAGSTYVALIRMEKEGVVELVSTSPDRYALA